MNTDDACVGPVNLGNPHEFTIKYLADLVISQTGSKSEPVYQDLPADDPIQRCPDIRLANKQLKWTPQVQLPEGLHKTMAYFRNFISN